MVMSPVVFQVVVSEYHSEESGLSEKRVIPGLGHEMYKINGSGVHLTKLNGSPPAPVYLALPEAIGQKGQCASRAGSGVMAQV